MDDWGGLAVRAQSGDLEAYGLVVRRFQDMAYGYGYSILGDFGLAEDAAQEAFVEAYQCLTSLRDPLAFPAWLRKIVFKQCDRITRRKRVPTVPLESAAETASREPGPDIIVERRQMREEVLAAIRALPEHEREVTALFYINGYSHEDIAGFLGVPSKTVKSRLHTARTRLKERMVHMVSDSLRENALGDEFTGKVIANIPPLKWGTGRECTFAGALESALSVTDHPCGYDTIMGGTALAFRTRWWKANDGTGWCGSNPVGEFPEEIEAAGKVTGWPIRIWCDLGNPEARAERFAPEIVASIDKGLPVLGYDEHLNMALICGYKDEGRAVLMRDYFRGDQSNVIEVDKLNPFLLFLTEYTGAASREDTLKMGLKLAVENFSWADPVPHPNRMGAYRYGKHAFAKWTEDIAHYDDYSQEELEKLHLVSWWCFSSLVDARGAAVRFLRANGVEAAADAYQREMNLLSPVFGSKDAFLGPWSGKSVADWTPNVRAREQELLAQVREMESEAIAEIEKALR